MATKLIDVDYGGVVPKEMRDSVRMACTNNAKKKKKKKKSYARLVE